MAVRTFEEIRKFIERKHATQSPATLPAGPGQQVKQRPAAGNQGTKIGVEELKAMDPHISALPDQFEAKRLRGMISIFTKYEVLAMLANPAGKLAARFPAQVEAIVRAGLGVDLDQAERGAAGKGQVIR